MMSGCFGPSDPHKVTRAELPPRDSGHQLLTVDTTILMDSISYNVISENLNYPLNKQKKQKLILLPLR